MDSKQTISDDLLERNLYVTDVFIDEILKYMSMEDVLRVIPEFGFQKFISVREFFVKAYEEGIDITPEYEFDASEFDASEFVIPFSTNVTFSKFSDLVIKILRKVIGYVSVPTKYMTLKGSVVIDYDVDKLMNVLPNFHFILCRHLEDVFEAHQIVLMLKHFI